MKKCLQTKNRGFTLIELIVVIVILGIVAAIAIPRFVNLQTDARIAVMSGVEGAMRGAADLVYSKSLIEGEEGSAAADVDISTGINITTVNGYPSASATGIVTAFKLSSDVSAASAAGVTTFTYVGQPACVITYAAAAPGAEPNFDISAITIANC